MRIIRRNLSCSTSDFAYCYTFLRSVVCLSVCHIRAPCLNRLTDLDAIWQVRYVGPDRVPDPQASGDSWSNPNPEHTIANCSQAVSHYAIAWLIQTKSSVDL